MDIDDDDDFYGGSEDRISISDSKDEKTRSPSPKTQVKPTKADEEMETGEEQAEEADEDDDDDSDIDIITERKDGTKAPPPPTAKYNEIRNIAQRTTSNEVTQKPFVASKDASEKGAIPLTGAELPAERTSTIDVDAKPIYPPARKPITQVDIDKDLPDDNERPWRRPGTDITDFFNYGFDEFTWALYAQKQESLRSEFADTQKKMMEDMSMMMGMGGMTGMPSMGMQAVPPASGMGMSSMTGMPGMDGNMPPEMQAMMQQMMAQGMDPSQMDASAMFGQGMSGQGGATGTPNSQQSGQAGNFGGQPNFGQGNQQGYGYDQNMGGGGGSQQGAGGHRGNFRGRGRGGNRW